MVQLTASICMIWLCSGSVAAQAWDIASDSQKVEAHSELPVTTDAPADWWDWKPRAGQFSLYVNTDQLSGDSVPRICILSDSKSWPFIMTRHGDTLYCHIAPPGFALPERSEIDRLPHEFPFVVLGGTDRAVYCLSDDSGQISLDPLEPADFLTVTSVRPLPDQVIYVQLPRSNNNAKLIAEVLQKAGPQTELIQLDDGFYQTVLQPVRKTTIRRWKLNETPLGIALFLRVPDVAVLAAIREMLGHN